MDQLSAQRSGRASPSYSGDAPFSAMQLLLSPIDLIWPTSFGDSGFGSGT
jgi:hypothetical protein